MSQEEFLDISGGSGHGGETRNITLSNSCEQPKQVLGVNWIQKSLFKQHFDNKLCNMSQPVRKLGYSFMEDCKEMSLT